MLRTWSTDINDLDAGIESFSSKFADNMEPSRIENVEDSISIQKDPDRQLGMS